MPKPLKKQKEIKAWAVCDSSNEPLKLSAFSDGALSGLILIFVDKKTAEKNWKGWRIVPITLKL